MFFVSDYHRNQLDDLFIRQPDDIALDTIRYRGHSVRYKRAGRIPLKRENMYASK